MITLYKKFFLQTPCAKNGLVLTGKPFFSSEHSGYNTIHFQESPLYTVERDCNYKFNAMDPKSLYFKGVVAVVVAV